MTKLYSIYDQANLGVSLQLSNSDQVVTTTVPGLSINRMVRCLYSLDVFPGNVEWMVFGTGSLTNLALVGVVDSLAVTTKYVWQDTHGFGYKPSDGKLYNNGAAVATWTTSAKDDIIAMAYNAADFSLSFYRGSASTGFVLLGSYTLPADTSGITGPWYPAASLGSTAAGDLSIWFNAGQQAFQYPLPGGDGWWIQTAQINPVRIASSERRWTINRPVDSAPALTATRQELAASISALTHWVITDRIYVSYSFDVSAGSRAINEFNESRCAWACASSTSVSACRCTGTGSGRPAVPGTDASSWANSACGSSVTSNRA